ncbi:hypothetical protein JCM3770_004759 [Rhodotorula araucariae]
MDSATEDQIERREETDDPEEDDEDDEMVSIVAFFTPGKTNVLADALSRMAEVDPDITLPPALEPIPAEDDDTPFPTESSGEGKMVLAALISALAPRADPASLSSKAESPLIAPLLSSELSAWVTSFSPAFAASLANVTASDPYFLKIDPTLVKELNPHFMINATQPKG